MEQLQAAGNHNGIIGTEPEASIISTSTPTIAYYCSLTQHKDSFRQQVDPTQAISD